MTSQYANLLNIRKNSLIEEHTLIGGFGSAVAEIIMDENLAGSTILTRLGLPDGFGEYGSQDQLLDYYGLSVNNICKKPKGVSVHEFQQ